jgi:hypothetical protein
MRLTIDREKDFPYGDRAHKVLDEDKETIK